MYGRISGNNYCESLNGHFYRVDHVYPDNDNVDDNSENMTKAIRAVLYL